MEQTRLLRARTVARCLAPNNLYCVGTADSDVLRQTIDNAVRYEAHFLEVYNSDILDPALASDISYAHQRLSRGRPVRRIAPRVSALAPPGGRWAAGTRSASILKPSFLNAPGRGSNRRLS